MNTQRKSNSVITVTAESDTVLVFTVLGAGEIRFDTEKANAALTQRAAMHGWKQRISDAAAMSRNPENGQPATPQEKMEAMAELIAHYESGTADWSRRGSGSGGGESPALVVEAVARVKGVSTTEASAMIDRMAAADGTDRKTAIAKLRKAGAVAKAMLAIKAERLAAVPADDGLLDGLK